MTHRRVVVFGPAYLDRVLRVNRPLVAEGQGPPLDQSVEGEWKFGASETLEIVAPQEYVLSIELPPDWPGPRGGIQLRGPIRPGLSGRRLVRAVAWSEDLGGMGAGYAAALGGVLHSALGVESDPTSRAILERMVRYGVVHRPIRVPDRPADWTLLVSSGEHGDKLPIGFRGCHAALEASQLTRLGGEDSDLLVVAALPNRLVDAVLRSSNAATRFLAPALRNMADREHPLGWFADRVDILSCNRTEWDTLSDREEVAERVAILAVTDGPRGYEIQFRDPGGRIRRFDGDAFPRDRPPRDTNRAGEAFASTLVATVLAHGWTGAARVVDEALIRMAADRAAAASALVLDRTDFGFPSPAEVDAALQARRSSAGGPDGPGIE